MQDPRISHYEALLHTLNYVSNTIVQGILLQGSVALTLQAFSDSDWASCPDSRRSVTGYVLLLGSPSSLGNQRSNQLSLRPLQKPNTEPWLHLLQRWYG